jgi:hypothetical protein
MRPDQAFSEMVADAGPKRTCAVSLTLWGFQPERSCHQVLAVVHKTITRRPIHYLMEAGSCHVQFTPDRMIVGQVTACYNSLSLMSQVPGRMSMPERRSTISMLKEDSSWIAPSPAERS